ncbi:hypothetical protein C4577_05490 [Candidatus Parcubacteria bacterium]|nr:MAG: hypothetical protein C4577_05490 [Candidatus Parcubacteria bacterium]
MSNKKDYIISSVLFLIGIFSRLPLVEKMQSHWDGPQYSIAMVRYSFEQQTPAPPGYPLYIVLGKLANMITDDPHRATLLVSVFFAGAGAIALYITGKTIFNRFVGSLSSLLFLSGPTFYYFGLTSYPYGLTPALASIFFLIGYLLIFKKKNCTVIFGIFFSLLIGFRPQDLFFFLPFYAWVLFSLPIRSIVNILLASLITFIAWFIPFVSLTAGSVDNYISLSRSFASAGALPVLSFNQIERYLVSIIKGYYLSFGLAGGFIVYFIVKAKSLSSIKNKITRKYIVLFGLWILPSFLFNLFIRSDHAGYQMIYLSALSILISYSIWSLFKKHKNTLVVIVFALILYNLINFFRDRDPNYKIEYQPTTFHYTDIRKNDLQLAGKVEYINTKFDPGSTLIVATPTLWRPIMYHLPNFLIYEFDSLITNDPRFKNIRRDAKGWIYKEYKVDKFEFVIPQNINTLILFDNGSYNWMDGKKEIVNLPGKSTITVVDVSPGEKYTYNLDKIKVQKQ